MSQHSGLSIERWRSFSASQRILMIANEMQRGRNALKLGEVESARLGYERVLRLVDLTVAVTARTGLLRELLRWRDLVAELYLAEAPDLQHHEEVERCLLLLDPVASAQLVPLGLA